MPDIDFPPNPTTGQLFTAPTGVAYQWNGYAWIVGYYDSSSQGLTVVGDIINQVRTLLQDTDNTASSGYRYSTDSLVSCLNQCMIDLFRLRPDLFLEQSFIIPTFNSGALGQALGIEQQYIPPLVYYVVGLAQARDDEQNQDSRAMVFLKTFSQSVLSVG
jgi:hypothetical protein